MFPLVVRYRTVVDLGEHQFALQRVASILEEYDTDDVRIESDRVVFGVRLFGFHSLWKRRFPFGSGSVSVLAMSSGQKMVTLEGSTTLLFIVSGFVGVMAVMQPRLKDGLLALALIVFWWLGTAVSGHFVWKRIKGCF